MRQKYLILFLIFLPFIPSVAQYNSRSSNRLHMKTRNKQISRFTVRTDFSKSKKYLSFGFGFGSSNYFGDLSPSASRASSDVSKTGIYRTGFYLHRFHPFITLRTSLSWIRLSGDDFSVSSNLSPTKDDKGRFIRNLSFRNDIFEISTVGLFEMFPTSRGYLRRNFINPYGILGISFFHHNPVSKTPYIVGKQNTFVDLQPLGTEGQNTGLPGTPKPYYLWQIGIPLGVGVRYRLSDKLDMGLEFCYRFLFTDYIDDVSGKFPTDSAYKRMIEDGNELGVKMSNRSAEKYSAFGLERRDNVFKSWKDPFTSKIIEGTGRIKYVDIDGNNSTYVLERYLGMQNGSSIRGSKKRDYWINTSISISYILEIKQKPPKFR